MSVTRARVREAVHVTLAAESGCRPADLVDGRVHVTERRRERVTDPARRRFPLLDPDFGIVTVGTGGVVSATSDWLGWARELFDGFTRDDLYDPSTLAAVERRVQPHGYQVWGPLPRFAASSDELAAPTLCDGFVLEEWDRTRAATLDRDTWPNALGRSPRAERPTVALAVARVCKTGELAGVASAAQENDLLCQIGIDVAARQRGRGLGAALTAAVARSVLERDLVPYYGTWLANVPSMRTATAAGLRLEWIEAAASPPRPRTT